MLAQKDNFAPADFTAPKKTIFFLSPNQKFIFLVIFLGWKNLSFFYLPNQNFISQGCVLRTAYKYRGPVILSTTFSHTSPSPIVRPPVQGPTPSICHHGALRCRLAANVPSNALGPHNAQFHSVRLFLGGLCNPSKACGPPPHGAQF